MIAAAKAAGVFRRHEQSRCVVAQQPAIQRHVDRHAGHAGGHGFHKGLRGTVGRWGNVYVGGGQQAFDVVEHADQADAPA